MTKPESGYLVEPVVIDELSKSIVSWRDRKQAEAAVAEAAKVAKAQADAAAAEAARIAEAKAEAAAQIAARISAEKALADSQRPATTGPCLRRYTDQKNCVTVVFGPNTYYDREGLKDHCIISDPFDALQVTHLGGD